MIDFNNKYSVSIVKSSSANCTSKVITPLKQIRKKYSKKRLTKENKNFLKIIGLK